MKDSFSSFSAMSSSSPLSSWRYTQRLLLVTAIWCTSSSRCSRNSPLGVVATNPIDERPSERELWNFADLFGRNSDPTAQEEEEPAQAQQQPPQQMKKWVKMNSGHKNGQRRMEWNMWRSNYAGGTMMWSNPGGTMMWSSGQWQSGRGNHPPTQSVPTPTAGGSLWGRQNDQDDPPSPPSPPSGPSLPMKMQWSGGRSKSQSRPWSMWKYSMYQMADNAGSMMYAGVWSHYNNKSSKKGKKSMKYSWWNKKSKKDKSMKTGKSMMKSKKGLWGMKSGKGGGKGFRPPFTKGKGMTRAPVAPTERPTLSPTSPPTSSSNAPSESSRPSQYPSTSSFPSSFPSVSNAPSESSQPSTVPTMEATRSEPSFTREQLLTAVDEFLTNRETAIGFFGPIEEWDVSRTTDFSDLFSVERNAQAAEFQEDLSAWDLSNAVTTESMFNGAQRFNSDIGEWDVSKVEDFSSMFEGAIAFNQDLPNWDVGSAVSFASMFKDALTFNGDITSWDVSNAEDFSSMFQVALAFNQDLNDWDTRRAMNLAFMFSGASAFNGEVSSWNVSNGENFSGMFAGASAFNQDISSWNVAQGTNFESMFEGTFLFNQDISSWNVQQAENLRSMFEFAVSFSQDLCPWASRLPDTADLADIFLRTDCVDESDPVIVDGVADTFCAICPTGDAPSVSAFPSQFPSVSSFPSTVPSVSFFPSAFPSVSQQPSESSAPSFQPSESSAPSSFPSTSSAPSEFPSVSNAPSESAVPSEFPSVSVVPSSFPSVFGLTNEPSLSAFPSQFPSESTAPSTFPSGTPSDFSTESGSGIPTLSTFPSSFPSGIPSDFPTESDSPTGSDSGFPTLSSFPSSFPSGESSEAPTDTPTDSVSPTLTPSTVPSEAPSEAPSEFPSDTPSENPTDVAAGGATVSGPTADWDQLAEYAGFEDGELFGVSLAISDDGRFFLAGAYQHSSEFLSGGRIEMIDTVGEVGIEALGQAQNDAFGFTVGMSGDAETSAAIRTSDGILEVFDEDFYLQQEIDPGLESYTSVFQISRDGNWLVIAGDERISGQENVLKAKVYQFDTSSKQFQQHGTDVEIQTTAEFGSYMIDITPDGSAFVISTIGDMLEFSQIGSFWVFRRGAVNDEYVLLGEQTVSGGRDDGFGQSVKITTTDTDEFLVAVGIPVEGRVAMYKYQSDSWELYTEINAGSEYNSDADFGYAVSMNRNGSRIVVGARCYAEGNSDGCDGAVQAFDIVGGTVHPFGSILRGNSWSFFGEAVAMSAQGNIIAVGAPEDCLDYGCSGSVYMFTAE